MLTPPVSRYMSLDPVVITAGETMTSAHRLMRGRHVRHPPVVAGAKLDGIVSDRDLHLLETLRDVDPDAVTVDEAMTTDVYAVAPDTPLDTVLEAMAERRLGSAVVVDDRGVVGIFTAVDALRALLAILDRDTN
jgi:acetoin utilization protein AcuB